jgi:hypothetical protein
MFLTNELLLFFKDPIDVPYSAEPGGGGEGMRIKNAQTRSMMFYLSFNQRKR